MLEQADAAAKQDRGEMDLEFVKQPGVEELLHGLRAARNPDSWLARRGAGLALPSVTNGNGRAPLSDPRCACLVRDDEDRARKDGGSSQPTAPASNMRRPSTDAPVRAARA